MTEPHPRDLIPPSLDEVRSLMGISTGPEVSEAFVLGRAKDYLWREKGIRATGTPRQIIEQASRAARKDRLLREGSGSRVKPSAKHI